MESYYHCCGMCRFLNLFDKDSWSGKFKCTERDIRCKATEDACSKYEHDSRRRYEDIEEARERMD